MKSQLWFVWVVLVIVCGVAARNLTGEDKPIPARTRWEYKVVERAGDEKSLNELGDQGWELVALKGGVSSGTAAASAPLILYFKRAK